MTVIPFPVRPAPPVTRAFRAFDTASREIGNKRFGSWQGHDAEMRRRLNRLLADDAEALAIIRRYGIAAFYDSGKFFDRFAG
jgi:hypothetical protein